MIAVASAKERAAGTLRRAGTGPPPHWASPHPRSLAVGPQYSSLGTQPILCASIPGLVPKQLRFCRNYVEIMPSVADGMKISIQECQHQFRGRRWNCTTVNNSLAIFGPVLDKGTRDTLLGPRCTWGAGAGAAAQGLPTLRQELPVSIQLSMSPALTWEWPVQPWAGRKELILGMSPRPLFWGLLGRQRDSSLHTFLLLPLHGGDMVPSKG